MPLKPTYLPELLITQRSALRRHSSDLADILFTTLNNERERLGVYLPWVNQLKGIDDERTFIKNSRRDWDELRTFDYGIYSAEENIFMGCVGAHTIRWDHSCCELGFWIAKPYEGKRFVSDAVAALESALFNIGFHRIEIRCHGRNERSARVAERAGFKFEGMLRENLFERGEYRDTMIWGKIRGA